MTVVARRILCLCCLTGILFCAGAVAAEAPKKVHNECPSCHSSEDFKAVKPLIKETCGKCHPTSAGKDHPVDIVSSVTPVDLPLGEGKKITCITCHEPHGKNTVEKLLRKSFNSLCIECHKNI